MATKKVSAQIVRGKLLFSCARDAGIKPGKPWTPAQRKKVSLCVARKTRSK